MDTEQDQKRIDAMFEAPTFVRLLPPLERALAAAKKGAKNPTVLSEDEIRIVCDTLLVQYAQMGIS